jgi:NDP-sugar pyrophosphorylase family protein
MLNIVIPMAGRGFRFVQEGYDLPKPLIPVCGKAMVHLVIDNLKPARPHRFIFLCLKEHLEKHNLGALLTNWAPGCEIITVDEITQGAACTVLLAQKYFNCDDSLLIANCDQWIDADINAFLGSADQQSLDGLIMTMEADDPKWSYVQFGKNGEITSVVEKQVVSNEATVGVYYFKKGSDFVDGAQQMIDRNRRVNGEFYVAPVYTEILEQGSKIGVFNIGAVGSGMHGLGNPADLEAFHRVKLGY